MITIERIEFVPDEAGIEELNQAALAILDEVALVVSTNAAPPVDTTFLLNSVYLSSVRFNLFDQTWKSGKYFSPAEGKEVDRQRAEAPEETTDENVVIVGWAAVYAWWVEDWSSFIYNALYDVAANGGEGIAIPNGSESNE